MSRLQELRKAAGYKSANDYADHLDIARTTYTGYEQGRSIPVDTAWRIADDLGVTMDYLLNRETKPSGIEYYLVSLNEEGKKRLLEYAEDLAGLDRYRK